MSIHIIDNVDCICVHSTANLDYNMKANNNMTSSLGSTLTYIYGTWV